MKWSMMIREGVLQVNLEPENDHEREAMRVLRKHSGLATVHSGVSIQECQGRYLRNFGESNDAVAITIHKEERSEP